MSTEPDRKSALRGVWWGIFFAMLSIWLAHVPPGFWSDDFVSNLFSNFFRLAGVYLGLLIFVSLIFLLIHRIKQGDLIKEDLSLVISILGLIVSIVGLFPNELRERIFAALRSMVRT